MGEALSIVAIVLLLALVAVSVRKQRVGMAQTNLDKDARNAGAEVQHERSLRRRSEARAAGRREH